MKILQAKNIRMEKSMRMKKKYAIEKKYMYEKQTSEKNIAMRIIQTKIIRIKKVKEWQVNKRKILMKSMRTEKSIERKTFVKCLFDKTKLKVHPIK